MMMNNFWNRVEHLRKSLGLSQQQLSRKIDVKQRTYEGWLRRDVLPDVEYGVRISHLLEASLEFLLTGEETALPDDEYAKTGTDVVVHTPKGVVLQEDEEPTFLVPIVQQKLSAGDGEDWLRTDHTAGHVRILDRMTRGIERSTLLAAFVKGDSMTGVQIFDGDLVIFAQGHISENGIYVISLFGEVKVKRLEFRSLEQKVLIHSENPKYSTEEAGSDNENLIILGKVIGWIHNHPY